MRITTGMITSQYSRNLNNSLNKLNHLNNRATTLRRFNRASEDPVAAAKAYSLRRTFTNNDDYTKNLEDTQNMLLTAESSIMSLNSIVQEASSGDILQSINGTMSKEDREIVATKLRKMQESMLSTLNSKYGDRYLFGGSDLTTPPFTVAKDGALLYKGVDITTGKYQVSNATIGNTTIDFGIATGTKFDGYTINIVDGTGSNAVDDTTKTININLPSPATNNQLQDALQALPGLGNTTIKGDPFSQISYGSATAASGNTVSLDELANEKLYVDIGLGLDVGADGLNEQSVFDTALPGINFLGYGTDNNGNPKNMYELLGNIATELEKPTLDMNATQPLINGFNNQKQVLLTQMTGFGSKNNFLKYNETRLEDTNINLNKKILTVEYVQPAEAIMDFKMQEFAYMAALQMGTKIIQPSFLDFMR